MKIEYDEQADAIYIQLTKGFVEDTLDLEEGISVDLDKDKHVIGIEILNASKRISFEGLTNIHLKNLPIRQGRAIIDNQ